MVPALQNENHPKEMRDTAAIGIKQIEGRFYVFFVPFCQLNFEVGLSLSDFPEEKLKRKLVEATWRAF
jgi:hypothetical protein